MKKNYFSFVVLIILSSACLSLAQMQPKSEIFGKYDRLLKQLQESGAQIYSPESYKKAIEYYSEASEDFDKQKDLKEIKEKLLRFQTFALEGLKNVEIAQSWLDEAIKMREKALDVGAPQFAAKLWERAEKKFKRAVENIEDNDREDVLKYGNEARELYDQAVRLALINSLLDEPRRLIDQAREQGAPELCYQTYMAALNALTDTEEMINANPDSLDSARLKADQAAYQARHALYLARMIKELRKKDKNWELLILKFEDLIKNIAIPFNYNPQFDEGFDKPVQTIIGYIANLKNENKRLVKENAELKKEINQIKEKETNLSVELQKRLELENKIKKIKELFEPGEAEVLVQDDNLLIRLFGLKFQPGKAIIQPEYFSLLTKVQRAIYEFPESYILVEGHTDASGSSYKNKVLSQQRAKAVKEYLIANLDLKDSQIEAIGRGDLEPIASNKTAEGRAKNRRIDIRIALPID
ncbi:OmpA family protein [Calditrichota bacterium LG25]